MAGWIAYGVSDGSAAAIVGRAEDTHQLALTHNLGGQPGECVSFVSVVGTESSS
jgi:hypothetical protein